MDYFMARRAHWIVRNALVSACIVGVLIAGILAGGCGYIRSVATGGLIEDVSRAALENGDVDLVMQALPTYLLLMEGLIRDEPRNPESLRAVAEGYTAYATLVEADDPRRAADIFVRAKHYGTAALVARRPAIEVLLSGPFSEFGDIDNHLRASDLPYVFWAASSWGAWIGAHTDSMAALADLPRVIHLMQWVLNHDESFRNGDPHVFLGVYHAALPPLLGGKPEQSLLHFERALELTEGHDLMARVQMARFYARQIFDRELYVSLLEQVLASPVDTVPELTLQNAAAQRLARTLLKEVDVYF